jgi:hypothetical protein
LAHRVEGGKALLRQEHFDHVANKVDKGFDDFVGRDHRSLQDFLNTLTTDLSSVIRELI